MNLSAVVSGLQRLGLPLVISEKLKPRTFLPGVWIHRGTLYVHASAHPSDVLHEAGHLAVIPARFRPLAVAALTNNPQSKLCKAISAYLSSEEHFAAGADNQLYRSIVNSDEQAAIAWSYAAAIELEYPTLNLFVYKTSSGLVPCGGDGQTIHDGLAWNAHPGINALAHSGMVSSVKTFPTLTRWLQL